MTKEFTRLSPFDIIKEKRQNTSEREEQEMREDKVAITKKLEELINMTREGQIELEYVRDYEYYDEAVLIKRDGILVGKSNVSCDSGIALIRDVLRNGYFN